MESCLGEKLRSARSSTGQTLRQVADTLRVKEATVSRWETGEREPDATTLARLADLYGVTTDYLLGRKEQGPPEVTQAKPRTAGSRKECATKDDLAAVTRALQEQMKVTQAQTEMLQQMARSLQELAGEVKRLGQEWPEGVAGHDDNGNSGSSPSGGGGISYCGPGDNPGGGKALA